MFAIPQNLQAVHAQIVHAEKACQRPENSVKLLAVSKTFGVDAVLQALQAGQHAFGENYLQEALEKIAAVQAQVPLYAPLSTPEWHFIGPIQSNKTAPIAAHFAWVHTIERLKIAQRLSQQRPPEMPALNVCIQVNISGEATKSGVAVHEALQLAREVQALPHLRLRGLMAIPAPLSTDLAPDSAGVEQQFSAMQRLFADIKQALQSDDFDTLSMGMSSDLAIAIAHGATIVRIGTAIFGARTYSTEKA
ncbi:MAG: YggS family pyridoxal phosphate-dependent enzyme [Burkholderiales bacterium]|nr:YggS family pyridoxal phosphate-dependent enzyme [Burkholderiales bacterium]